MFRIGDFSRLSSISVRMLRHYDKIGLLCPDVVDKFTGFRYYSAVQLRQVNQIQHLKQLGFSLAMIKQLIQANDPEDLERYLLLRQEELKEEMEQITAQAHLLRQAIEALKGDQAIMEYTVVLKKLPARKVAGVRGTLGDYSQEGMLWGKLYEGLYAMGATQAKAPLLAAIYHDKEYKEGDVDVEVTTQVQGDFKDDKGVRFYTTQEVLAATVTFSGSYQQMPGVTEAAAAWIESNGYRMDGTMFNLYHVGPPAESSPDKWVTEACFPVTK